MAETRGITIKFRGDDTDFTAAVKKINGEIKQTKSEISLLNKQLRFDPKNVDTLTKKFNLLRQREKELTEQTKVLDEGLKQIDPNSKEWDKYNQQLQKATVELESIRKELDSLPTAKMQVASQNFQEWGEKLEGIGGKIENVGSKLSVLSAGIIGLGTAGVKFNAQLEQYQTAYTTLIGDADKASQVIKQIQESASKTPFSTESLIEANQYLISAGVEAEESQKMILALGDAIAATGGGSNELSRMAQNLQQIKNLGKASSVDIKQFANAGINIYGLLAQTTGKSVEKLKEMDITYEQLLEAFSKASSEGGTYFGAMEKQSETLNGSISTLKDQINQLLGDLTSELLPIIKNVLKYISDVVKRLKEMSPEQKQMILRIAEIIAVIGPFLVILGKIITSLGGISLAVGALLQNKELISFVTQAIANGGKLGGVIKTILDLVKSFIGPIGIIIGLLVALYASSEEFRNAVDSLAKTLMSLVEPAFNLIKEIALTLWQAIKDVVEVIKFLWKAFLETEAGQQFINTMTNIVKAIEVVIGWVEKLISWLGGAIGKARDFIGSLKDVNSTSLFSTGGLAGTGGRVWIESGGIMSGGITLNNSFTINNGKDISKETVLQWADVMTDRINENLGRMV